MERLPAHRLGVSELHRRRADRSREVGIFTGGLEAQRIDIVTKYIAEHTAPDDPIFVVPWASGFYFLANRSNPTRIDFMLFEDPEAYPCLLSRLDERPPKYVIYGYTWDVDDRHFRDYAAPDRSLHPIALRDRVQHGRL